MRFGTWSMAAAAVLLATLVGGNGTALAQVPDEAIGARLSPILLLSRTDVRQELALTAEQSEAVFQAIGAFHAKAESLRGRSGPEAIAARREIDEEAGRWIAERLDEEQRARLDQIDLQWQGASALVSRPTIAASLELTTEQRTEIQQALARGYLDGEGPIQAHRRIQRDAVAVLDEQQRLRWFAMVGRPFEPGD